MGHQTLKKYLPTRNPCLPWCARLGWRGEEEAYAPPACCRGGVGGGDPIGEDGLPQEWDDRHGRGDN